ncbi:MAG: bifunctional 4-hydroxy-2-oxoglutarate aldolase/2-dehydro-3-deoxy-phosphogluconate aldolase [Pseudomonadales bacterium]
MTDIADSPFHAAALRQRSVPLLTITDLETLQPLLDRLRQRGVRCLEIALRSPVALQALAAVRRDHPDMLVAAGTVWTREQWRAAEDAGAHCLISPAAPLELLDHAAVAATPWLPAAQTPTEFGLLRSAGYRIVKFFPAEAAGGVAAVRALAAVLPEIRICPSGGINADNRNSYLAEPAVAWVSGSWSGSA